MPGFNEPADEWLPNQLARLRWQQRALAHQQQYTCSDAQGRPVINMGLIPGSSPAEYGMQLVNPATGLQVMFVGEDASGNPYMVFTDSGGHPRIRLGLLADGNYGLAVYSPANDGTYVELSNLGFGLQSNETSTYETTASNGVFVDLATPGPTVSVTVGNSGRALVTASAYLVPGPNADAQVGLSVDGSTPTVDLLSYQITTGSESGTFTAQTMVTGLSAGTHTFKLQYCSSNGATSGFESRVLTVQPF